MRLLMQPLLLLLSLLTLTSTVTAQFDFFEQMFGGGGGGGHGGQREEQNMPSDSQWYRENYAQARCTNYLCPGTLSCVHFPHHCPCAFPNTEDKVELGEGIAVCASKGGWAASEMGRKVELARKGLL